MRTVLITGAARGIGKATASLYEQQGYNVIGIDVNDLDLTDLDAVRCYAREMPIKPDIIVNNAGINNVNNVDELLDKDIEDTTKIIYLAPLYLIREIVPYMKEKRFGRIVNLGSIWSVVSKGGRTTYCAAKHAIHGVTNTLAVELGEYNILVNTVCPGFTNTEMTSKNNTPEQVAQFCEEIPLGRMAQPNEIAELIFFLGSEKNTYITGQKMVIDGGFTVR